MRTIPAAAANEAAKISGASYFRVLEIQWDAETVLYTDEPHAELEDAEARVVDWGSLKVAMKPKQIGGFGTVSIVLSDVDGAIAQKLRSRAESDTQYERPLVFVHLYFRGTEWPADRVTEFGGSLASPAEFKPADATWSLTIDGFEKFHQREIGIKIDRNVFDVRCEQASGKILPIPFGAPVERYPIMPIDRPGYAVLNEPLYILGTYLVISMAAGKAGFTVGSEISIFVGLPGGVEQFIGQFDNADSRVFRFTARSIVMAQGLTQGLLGIGGQQYVLIKKEDLPGFSEDPAQEPYELNGYPLVFPDQSTIFPVQSWKDSGANIGVLPIGSTGFRPDRKPEAAGGFLEPPGVIPVHQPGMPVWEDAPFVYAVSALPVKSVERVEGLVTIGGVSTSSGEVQAWAQINPIYYEVTYDNRSFNSVIGRELTDPGLTTLIISQPPGSIGVNGEIVFVTCFGLMADDAPEDRETEPALEHAAEVFRKLATSPFLGKMPSDRVNEDSLEDLLTNIPDLFVRWSILEPKNLFDLLGNLAYQSQCVSFFDQGQLFLRRIAADPRQGVNSATITEANAKRGSVSFGPTDPQEMNTRVTGKFRKTPTGKEYQILIKSDDAIAALGERTMEVPLNVFEQEDQAIRATAFWMQYELSKGRQLKGSMFLDSIRLQPGDILKWRISDAAGEYLDGEMGRILEVARNVRKDAPDEIQISCEAAQYSFELNAVPDPQNCEYVDAPVIPQYVDDSPIGQQGFSFEGFRPFNTISQAIRPVPEENKPATGGGGGTGVVMGEVISENEDIAPLKTVKVLLLNVTFDDSDEGNSVSVSSADTEVYAANPRNNYVKRGMRVFLFQIDGKYVIDNQTTFLEDF